MRAELHHGKTLREFLHLPANRHEVLGGEHDRVLRDQQIPPKSAVVNSDAPAASVFGFDVCGKVFPNSKRVGHLRLCLVHSHCSNSPDHLSREASGKNGTTVDSPTLKFHLSANFRFRDASCSEMGTQKCNAALRANGGAS